MSPCKTLLSLVLLSLPIAGFACTGDWSGSTSQNWGDPTNWVGCVPSASPDAAVFTGLGQGIIVLVDSTGITPINPTVQQLAFDNGSYTINPNNLTAPASSLTLEYTLSGEAFGILLSPANVEQVVINTPMTWNGSSSPTPMQIYVGTGSSLTIAGTVTDGGMTTVDAYMSGGPFINTNYSPLVNQSMTLNGSEMLAVGFPGALDIDGGAFQITNALTIPSGNGPSVFTTNMAGHVYIYAVAGPGELDIINSGEVVGFSGASLNTAYGDLNLLTGTTLYMENTGTIVGDYGAHLALGFAGGGNLTLASNTTMTLNNNNCTIGTGSGDSYGVIVTLNDTFTCNGGSGGTVTLENVNATINSGWGVYFSADTMNMNSGAVTISNAGTVTLGTGAMIQANSLNMSGGTITISNSGTVSAGQLGAEFLCITTTTQTGGIIDIQASSPPQPGISTSFEADEIDVNGSDAVFSNDSSVYTSTFNLEAGTVVGLGTFGSNNVINSGGTLSPGDPASLILPIDYTMATPNTMNISATYNQTYNGILSITVLNSSSINDPGPTTYSQLAVDGTASLGNGLVQVAVGPGAIINAGDTITILTTTPPGGLGGTMFNPAVINFNGSLPAGLTPTLSYDTTGSNVLLSFLSTNTPPAIVTFSSYPSMYQSIFASVNHTHTRLEREMQKLRNRFSKREKSSASASNPKSASSFLSRADQATDAKLATLPIHTVSNELVVDNHDSIAFLGWHRREHGKKTCEEAPVCCPEARHWNIYFGPLGTVGEIHNKHNQPGFSDWSVGALAGFDYAFEQGGIGLLADYEKIIGSVHQNWGRFDIKQAHFSFYGTYVPKSVDRLSFDGIVGGGYDWYHIHRHTPGKTAKGTTQGAEFDALFGLAYNAYGRNDGCGPTRLQVTPMANLQYIYLDRSRYKEHQASSFDFKVHSQVNKSLRSTLGTWISYAWDWTDFSFTPELYLAWQREYFDHNHSLSASSLVIVEPTQSLTIIGAGRNTLQAGLDLMFTMFNQYGIEVSYDFEWNKLFHDNAFYVGFNVEF